MASESGFATYILEEVLVDVPGVASRRMFGGYGIYKDGKIFGMIADDKLYFKVGEHNRKLFEDMGSKPFTYEHKSGKTVAMSYYEVPENMFENREALLPLIESSLGSRGNK